MKKFFTILLMICLMVSVLSIASITAFAADAPADEPAAGTVLRISATESDGDTVVVADHTNFVDGWNAAMELANDMEDYDYTRVIVDIYTDWKVHGEFGSGDGFANNAIYFNDDVKMTLNMNGHTIDRGITSGLKRRDGEVMYIDTDADVIINNGTITRGGSFSGAGGIHINSDAKVALNNVNVIGNVSWDDDGGGIALYDGASLVMNGGSLKDNELLHDMVTCYGGAIYAEESFVTLNDVEIKNNRVLDDNDYGAAIYADESTVVLNGCKVDGNGKKNDEKNHYAAISIIHAIDSSITVTKTSFTNNGGLHYVDGGHGLYKEVSTLIYLDESSLVLEGSGVTENTLGYLIHATDNSEFFVSGTNITRNTAIVLKSTGHSIDSYFNGCTFGDNITSSYTIEKYPFLKYSFNIISPVTFYNCNMGNSTYSNPANIKFINQNLDSGIALTVSGRKVNGTVVKIEEYRSFEIGWAAAMELATNSYWMSMNAYEYVVVDMHVDWIASNGRFTNAGINGIGFNSDTIHVSEEACLILNMNGYKIDRGLTDSEANGEVMYIASGADIIINDGTITGGYSDNGAGGIHISGDAKVTLNNVHVKGNKVINDDGAGIAVYGGATFIMNGGSVSDNVVIEGLVIANMLGCGIYVEDSTAILTDVTLKNNQFEIIHADYKLDGAAVYSDDSTVTLKDCTVEDNAVINDTLESYDITSVIYAEDSTMVIENTNFSGNGDKNLWRPMTASLSVFEATALIHVSDSELTMTGGRVSDNNTVFLVNLVSGMANVDGVDFTGNDSHALYVRDASKQSTFSNCKFSAGSAYKDFNYDFHFEDEKAGITFVDCDFGKATFSDKNAVTFVGGTVSNGIGSIFGEGSLSMIVSILSLIASGVAIFLVVYYNKKKAVPATANNATEPDEEE